jgi:acyl-CoA thioesterase FadM
MAEKEFVFEKTIYLGNTNMFGNVYFARYFDWQGEAREAFFHKTVPDSLAFFKSGIKFVTIEASIKYNKETTVFDEVIIKVRAENFKITTLDLIFTYIDKKTGGLIAMGKQKIGFVDANNKVIPIPDKLKASWSKFIGQK